MRSRISIRGCVRPSVGPSVRPSVRPSHTSWNRAKTPFLITTTISTSENASYAVYPALFFLSFCLPSFVVLSFPNPYFLSAIIISSFPHLYFMMLSTPGHSFIFSSFEHSKVSHSESRGSPKISLFLFHLIFSAIPRSREGVTANCKVYHQCFHENIR